MIGYFIFYRKYENRELVNELRKHNLELKHMFQSADRDRLEYEQQNIILKDEISILYQKNDDLNVVVSELSRYYYHLKKISSKMNELSHYLQQPLDDLDSKIASHSGSRNEYDDYESDERDDFVYKLSDEEKNDQK